MNYVGRVGYNYAWMLSRFLSWLSECEGFSGVNPDLLVQMQRAARIDPDPDAQYRLVDIVADYLRECSLEAKSSRLQVYSVLRGFFAANGVPLPEDPSLREVNSLLKREL